MTAPSESRVRILGVDPGSRLTGFGVVDVRGSSLLCVEHGTLSLQTANESLPLETRLRTLYRELRTIITTHRPDVLAIERVFFAKNALSALKLGHARGVVLLAAAESDMPVFEYAPTAIKSALTGSGRSEKEKVAEFVKLLIGTQTFKTFDASDAVAVAICHARHAQTGAKIGDTGQTLFRRTSARRGSKSSMAHAVAHRLGSKK